MYDNARTRGFRSAVWYLFGIIIAVCTVYPFLWMIGTSFKEMVEIYVPRRPRGEEQRYWICVNGRSVLIPANGEKQLMRRPFAEVLENRLKAEAEADRVLDGIEAHDPMSNPYK